MIVRKTGSETQMKCRTLKLNQGPRFARSINLICLTHSGITCSQSCGHIRAGDPVHSQRPRRHPWFTTTTCGFARWRARVLLPVIRFLDHVTREKYRFVLTRHGEENVLSGNRNKAVVEVYYSHRPSMR